MGAPTEKETLELGDDWIEDKLDKIGETLVDICQVYSATVLYAYNKWLQDNHFESTTTTVQEYLEQEGVSL